MNILEFKMAKIVFEKYQFFSKYFKWKIMKSLWEFLVLCMGGQSFIIFAVSAFYIRCVNICIGGGRSQVWLSVVISEYLRCYCVSFPYTPVTILLLPIQYPRPNLSRENKNWIRNATDQYQVWITIPKIEFKNLNGIYNATSFEIYILFGFYCQVRRLVVDRLKGSVHVYVRVCVGCERQCVSVRMCAR